MFMKKLVVFICLIVLSCCHSVSKNIWESKKFVPLEKSIVPQFMEDYSLEIPSNWYSYLGYHEIFHSPKKTMIKNLNDQKVTLYVSTKEDVEDRNVFFENEIKIKNIFAYPDFEKKIINYEKYGEALFLKYGTISESESYTNLDLFYFYKNKIYALHFKSSNDFYLDLVDEALTIMESFKVKE